MKLLRQWAGWGVGGLTIALAVVVLALGARAEWRWQTVNLCPGGMPTWGSNTYNTNGGWVVPGSYTSNGLWFGPGTTVSNYPGVSKYGYSPDRNYGTNYAWTNMQPPYAEVGPYGSLITATFITTSNQYGTTTGTNVVLNFQFCSLTNAWITNYWLVTNRIVAIPGESNVTFQFKLTNTDHVGLRFIRLHSVLGNGICNTQDVQALSNCWISSLVP